MPSKSRLLVLSCLVWLAITCSKPAPTNVVPVLRTWDDEAMKTLEVPLSEPSASPVHVPAAYYYSIPERTIFKTYPVYAPDKEPSGYIERIQSTEPEGAFDPKKLKTELDWIRAGEIVFDAPITTGRLGSLEVTSELFVRDPKWYAATKPPLTKDGSVPFLRYVVSQKGKVEVGILACGMCHTRVMPDGSVLKGAQGNFPFDRAMGTDYRVVGQIDN